jgi:hypothetical protein
MNGGMAGDRLRYYATKSGNMPAPSPTVHCLRMVLTKDTSNGQRGLGDDGEGKVAASK